MIQGIVAKPGAQCLQIGKLVCARCATAKMRFDFQIPHQVEFAVGVRVQQDEGFCASHLRILLVARR